MKQRMVGGYQPTLFCETIACPFNDISGHMSGCFRAK